MKGLYKGFCQNENGKETIYLNGEAVNGEIIEVKGVLIDIINAITDFEEVEEEK